ncbi:MAG: septum formation initiator family protein [Micrococcales bacterium]|nr:septum formation initiator family protein [Micrococcales bacterium]
MSAATARQYSSPQRTSGQRAPRPAPLAPRLRLVRPPQQVRTRVPFVLTCMGILVTALLAALLLNTAMAQAAFETTDAQRQLARLVQDNEDLQARLDEKSSPEQLAAQARALGMVPATGTGWIRLSDQTVSGVQDPAPAETPVEAPAGTDGPAPAEPEVAPTGEAPPEADGPGLGQP